MTKLKLNACVVAVLAASVLVAADAGATTGGHFTSTVTHTTIIGSNNTAHPLHFRKGEAADSEAVGCESNIYSGTVVNTTFESISLKPEWSNCHTTDTSKTKFDIAENGCAFTFTIGKTGTHHTVDLTCPFGNRIEIKHPNCTVVIAPQTMNGVVYNTATGGFPAKHTITMALTVSGVAAFYESGICVFLGTQHIFEMKGSVTVEGFDTDGARVDITATTTTP